MFDYQVSLGQSHDDAVRRRDDAVRPDGGAVRHHDEAVRHHDDALAAERAVLAGEVDDAVVAGIRHLEGCAELADWLAAVDVTRLGDFDVVEVVAGFERVAAWAKARAAVAAVELAGRASMNPRWPATVGRVARPCTAGIEVSLRLGVTPQAGRRMVEVGTLLSTTLMATGAALDRGELDWGKAAVIAEALGEVPWQVALAVEDVVLPVAAHRTHPQLRRDLARALLEVDPDDAQERHARAVSTRRVERPRVLPDGMASIRAVLPADAAVRLDATLHGAAVAARAAGDLRTVDQLRADALDAMAQEAWTTGWIGPAPDAASMSRAAPARQVTAGLPGPEGAGVVEPVPPAAVSAGTEPAAERFRLGRQGGRRAQLMVTVGYGTLIGLDQRPAELAGYGPVGADVARRIARDGTWRRLLVDAPTGTVLDVGRTRYRPPADMAELVRARNPYCVIPTCSVPSSRCDLDHTIPFDHTVPLDHSVPQDGTVPLDRTTLLDAPRPGEVRGLVDDPGSPHRTSPSGGQTAAHNLGPMCRSGHLIKTHAGYRVVQLEPGTFALRTPTGHRYRESPPRPPGVPLHDALPWLRPDGRPVRDEPQSDEPRGDAPRGDAAEDVSRRAVGESDIGKPKGGGPRGGR